RVARLGPAKPATQVRILSRSLWYRGAISLHLYAFGAMNRTPHECGHSSTGYEHQAVTLVVVGSSPTGHPCRNESSIHRGHQSYHYIWRSVMHLATMGSHAMPLLRS